MAKWIIDADHSVATFSVRHFMVANVVGIFGKITGLIQFDPPDLVRLSAEAEIDVARLSTGNEQRDKHLLSPDYFDVAKYPKIIFKSKKVASAGGSRADITGDLTIRGITHSISFRVEFYGPVKSPFSGKSCIGFSGTAKINREEYGMTLNQPMEGGGVVVGKEVSITFEVEADLAE
jgi:polyisoprenoid-binding protein YceI